MTISLASMVDFRYRPDYPGQDSYILIRCEDEKIKAVLFDGEIRIFSEQKIKKLKTIIDESLNVKNSHNAPIKNDFEILWNNKLIGYAIAETRTIFVIERYFRRLKYFQYLGKVPMVKHYRIFGTRREMEESFTCTN